MREGDLVVRELRGGDVGQVIELLKGSFPQELSVAGFDEETVRKQFKLYGLLRRMQRLARRPFLLFLVGELRGRPVAMVSLTRKRRAWYVGTVVVDQGHRRRGYGRTILTQALKRARAFGGERAVLHVLEDNLPAKRLYESLGFELFERAVYLKREPAGQVSHPFPIGCGLKRIGLIDRKATEISHAAKEPGSAEIYGRPELPPWYARPLARFQPGGYGAVRGYERAGVGRCLLLPG